MEFGVPAECDHSTVTLLRDAASVQPSTKGNRWLKKKSNTVTNIGIANAEQQSFSEATLWSALVAGIRETLTPGLSQGR